MSARRFPKSLIPTFLVCYRVQKVVKDSQRIIIYHRVHVIKMVPLVFQASNLAASYEKKQKKIDQEIAQWKAKVDEVQAELEASQRESRANSTEVSTLICARSSVVTSSTKPFRLSRFTSYELSWRNLKMRMNN